MGRIGSGKECYCSSEKQPSSEVPQQYKGFKKSRRKKKKKTQGADKL